MNAKVRAINATSWNDIKNKRNKLKEKQLTTETSIHNEQYVCLTKNENKIFDFEKINSDFSRIQTVEDNLIAKELAFEITRDSATVMNECDDSKISTALWLSLNSNTFIQLRTISLKANIVEFFIDVKNELIKKDFEPVIFYINERAHFICKKHKKVVLLATIRDERYASSIRSLNIVSMIENTFMNSLVEKHHLYEDVEVFYNLIHYSTVNTPNGLAIKFNSKIIKKSDFDLPKQCFYPWLNEPIKNYIEKYMKSKANILVLYGEPGTGKTTFAREFVKMGYKVAFSTSIQTANHDELYSTFNESDNDILLVEEADAALAKRTDGNTVMASILNQADGLIKTFNKKIVFVSNLENIKNFDQAIVRPGRCFDAMKFRHLTAEEALVVRKEMNMTDINLNSRQTWSLAATLNTFGDNDEFEGNTSRTDSSIGFTKKDV